MANKAKKPTVKKKVAKKKTVVKKSAIRKAAAKIGIKKISARKQESLCVYAVFGLIAITLIAASVMLLIENQFGNVKAKNNANLTETGSEEQPAEPFEYEGWINCMPPLDAGQAELCKRAEAAGYDKIAY